MKKVAKMRNLGAKYNVIVTICTYLIVFDQRKIFLDGNYCENNTVIEFWQLKYVLAFFNVTN